MLVSFSKRKHNKELYDDNRTHAHAHTHLKRNLTRRRRKKIFSYTNIQSETNIMIGLYEISMRSLNGICPRHKYMPLSFFWTRLISKPSIVSERKKCLLSIY